MGTLSLSDPPFMCVDPRPKCGSISRKTPIGNSSFYGPWCPSSSFGALISQSRRVSLSKRGSKLSKKDPKDVFTDTVEEEIDSLDESVGLEGDDVSEIKMALSRSQGRQEVIEKERDRLLEELAMSESKQREYEAVIRHEKEIVMSELEAAKAMFNKRLEESLEDKFKLESKLVLAKQDAVELALQVEKLAEIAFQQAISHIVDDAQNGTVLSILEESQFAINKALASAEQASHHAEKAVSAISHGLDPADDIAVVQSQNIELQNVVNDLKSQLLLKGHEIQKVKEDLEQALASLRASEDRTAAAEKALIDIQDLMKKQSQQQEETKSLLEKMKKDIAEKRKASTKSFKIELEGIKTAVEAAKEAARLKDEAYARRCESLQRSLKASENALKIWKQRADMAESYLEQELSLGERDEDVIYTVNGGRIDLLTDDDTQKKTDVSEALAMKFPSVHLPTADEVWSIAQEKPREGDTLIEHVIEKEIIEKKRKALERALKRKTVQWERTPEHTKLEPGTGTGREIVLQAFNWESWRRKWYLELSPKAADLSHSGITAVWIPPPTESVAPQGYMPSDLYNLNSAYGSEEELKHCIEEMHAQDLLALGDVVLNHRCAQKQSPNGVWNIFGGKLAWGPEAIVCDDPNFQGRGNPSSGDIFHAAPNIDHSQEFVRRDIKEWLNWLRNDIGFDGWRLDFVRGFSGGFVKEYIEASNPAFAIGEYWDSLAYEGGNLCYNQDAHRQRIVNWINATGGTSSAFDVTTKGILHSALHNQYWRLIDPQGKPTGVMGWWPSRAVTFLENHDTGSTQGHWPFPREKLAQGYAYILMHPGTPVIFYDHFYDFGLRDVITELIEARRRAGIHCRSSVKIYHANNDGYVAQIGDTLVMKLGHFDWNPSKENQLEGSWQKFVDKGSDYQLWLRQ
ncbi:hypothetical protein Sjap_024023 [Stephania japonica]|uniref:alpha-amylase n=1 Tax=Stephania japonica TaxID=461633 RepID=A0AAP0ECN9_9MAGN